METQPMFIYTYRGMFTEDGRGNVWFRPDLDRYMDGLPEVIVGRTTDRWWRDILAAERYRFNLSATNA